MNVIDVEKDRFAGDSPRARAKVVEIGLLLESELLTALEAAVREQGMTLAATVRHLIRDFVHRASSEGTEDVPLLAAARALGHVVAVE